MKPLMKIWLNDLLTPPLSSEEREKRPPLIIANPLLDWCKRLYQPEILQVMSSPGREDTGGGERPTNSPFF
jgi:hypothetical protein